MLGQCYLFIVNSAYVWAKGKAKPCGFIHRKDTSKCVFSCYKKNIFVNNIKSRSFYLAWRKQSFCQTSVAEWFVHYGEWGKTIIADFDFRNQWISTEKLLPSANFLCPFWYEQNIEPSGVIYNHTFLYYKELYSAILQLYNTYNLLILPPTRGFVIRSKCNSVSPCPFDMFILQVKGGVRRVWFSITPFCIIRIYNPINILKNKF